MKLIGFLQNYNGVENGDLRMVLSNMANVVDHIYVYDDASTENVQPLYDEYDCVVIKGVHNSFRRELFHKDQLLTRLLWDHPDVDWIVWYDSDAVLGSYFDDRKNLENLLSSADRAGNVQIYLHNLNLWRSPKWYRVDQSYDELWHCVFWKNTGQLSYYPRIGLHQKQWPMPFYPRQDGQNIQIPAQKFQNDTAQLLHFGFSDLSRICQKYYRYRDNGQTGWPLTRLIDEKDMNLHPTEEHWFPKGLRFLWNSFGDLEPEPILPSDVPTFNDFEEWEAARLKGEHIPQKVEQYSTSEIKENK